MKVKEDLAWLYRYRGQYDQAEALFKEVLAARTANLGAGNPETFRSKNNLAWVYQAQGQFAKAEPLLRELVELYQQKAAVDLFAYAAPMGDLGWTLLRQQKAADAERVLRACVPMREQQDPDAWHTLNFASTLGGALLAQKKFAEAEPLLLKGYEGLKAREARIPVPDQFFLREASERLVQLYDATGQKDRAGEWRQKAAKIPAKPTGTP